MNIEEVNRNNATPYLYDCDGVTNKTNDYKPLSLNTGSTTVCSGSKENWF